MQATVIDAEDTAVDKIYPPPSLLPQKILPSCGLHTDGGESQKQVKHAC